MNSNYFVIHNNIINGLINCQKKLEEGDFTEWMNHKNNDTKQLFGYLKDEISEAIDDIKNHIINSF